MTGYKTVLIALATWVVLVYGIYLLPFVGLIGVGLMLLGLPGRVLIRLGLNASLVKRLALTTIILGLTAWIIEFVLTLSTVYSAPGISIHRSNPTQSKVWDIYPALIPATVLATWLHVRHTTSRRRKRIATLPPPPMTPSDPLGRDTDDHS